MTSTATRSEATRNTTYLGHVWSRLASSMRVWREREQCRRELQALAERRELGRVLTDAGLAEWQVPAVLHSDPRRAELLDRMMRRVGIDSTKPVPGRRDLEWTCSGCRQDAVCRNWLMGAGKGDYHEFCPNAEELDAIKGAK
jgi:uncharacterized protein YjiS (DUF1127 family)